MQVPSHVPILSAFRSSNRRHGDRRPFDTDQYNSCSTNMRSVLTGDQIDVKFVLRSLAHPFLDVAGISLVSVISKISLSVSKAATIPIQYFNPNISM